MPRKELEASNMSARYQIVAKPAPASSKNLSDRIFAYALDMKDALAAVGEAKRAIDIEGIVISGSDKASKQIRTALAKRIAELQKSKKT